MKAVLLAATVFAAGAYGFAAAGGQASSLDGVGVALTPAEMSFEVGQSGCPPVPSWNPGVTCTLAAVPATCTPSSWWCCVAYPVGNTACNGEPDLVPNGPTVTTIRYFNNGCTKTYLAISCDCVGVLRTCVINTVVTPCPGVVRSAGLC